MDGTDDEAKQPQDALEVVAIKDEKASEEAETEKWYRCKVCLDTFPNKAALKKHIWTHVGSTPFTCKVCNKEFPDLKSHMLTHTVGKEKPYPCEDCDKSFYHASGLGKHRKYVHNIVTNKLTTTKVANEIHSCPTCGKIFPRKSGLQKHMVIHTGERPYQCNLCPKNFTQAGHLKRHILYHTGEKPYACKVCQKRFTESGSLKNHMLVHTGERPHLCTVCGKSFASLSYMKIHTLRHTGVKPYPCKVCGKSYTQAITLREHMFIHTGEKPHLCTLCGKSFAASSSYRMHMARHSGEQIKYKRPKKKKKSTKFANQLDIDKVDAFGSGPDGCKTEMVENGLVTTVSHPEQVVMKVEDFASGASSSGELVLTAINNPNEIVVQKVEDVTASSADLVQDHGIVTTIADMSQLQQVKVEQEHQVTEGGVTYIVRFL